MLDLSVDQAGTCTRLAILLRVATGCVCLVIGPHLCAAQPRVPRSPEERILERALKLLPTRPLVPIRFVDPDLVADPEAIRRLDAFLVRERDGRVRQVIYLNRWSPVVANALTGRDLDVAVLASVVRHEMEHLRGAEEPEARRAEREFFQHLLFTGHVPTREGLAYLADLQQGFQLREGR